MDESEKKLVKDIALQNGYLIEFEVSKALNAIDDSSKTISMGHLVGNNNIEIDVVAAFYKKHYLIECKGCEKKSFLILVKAPSLMKNNDDNSSMRMMNVEFGEMPRPSPNGDGYIFEYKIFNFNINHKNSAPYTVNGDFHKNGSTKKFDTADSRSNLYKAQQQICEAMVNYEPSKFEHDDDQRCSVIPMIVTNSNICVIDYEKENEPVVAQHKWVIHRVANKLKNLRIIKNNNNRHKTTVFQLLIVNKRYVKELVEIINKHDNYSVERILIQESVL